jgi:hypothetical protein
MSPNGFATVVATAMPTVIADLGGFLNDLVTLLQYFAR